MTLKLVSRWASKRGGGSPTAKTSVPPYWGFSWAKEIPAPGGEKVGEIVKPIMPNKKMSFLFILAISFPQVKTRHAGSVFGQRTYTKVEFVCQDDRKLEVPLLGGG
jgi:hypothetical protein